MRPLVLVLLVGCSTWTPRDIALEGAFLAVTALDWHQTVDITAGCTELNPVMGKCGEIVPVGVYFPIAMAAHIAVAALLPPGWRTAFQGFTLGMESATTFWNLRVAESH